MNAVGIVFDVDGVIIDVRESYHFCIKETAEFFLKRELSIQQVTSLKFKSGINNDYLATLHIIRHFGGDADLERLIEVFDSIYERLKDKEKLILNRAFFESLRRRGFRLGILTGRPRRDLNYAFERFNLHNYFEVVVDDDTIEDKNLRKPHPYALNFCVLKMGVERAVYIGDSLSDYRMWFEYLQLYRLPPIKYIHFGSNSHIEHVHKASDQEELSDVLQEVLRDPW